MNQDILNITKGVIVHQVNCQGVMECGIALQIRNKWPQVYKRYRAFKFHLGQIQIIAVAPQLWVCNLAGQDGFGRDRQYTNYVALREGFSKLNIWAKERSLPIAIPYNLGCNNAGGMWTVVRSIIDKKLSDCQITFYCIAKI